MLAAQNPIERLLVRAAETPDAPWLYQSINGVWSALSYSQIADQVLRMAAAIQAQGIAPGSAIGIGGRNTAHWVMADLAISAAGCVSVGLYPKQSVDHLQYILKHCEAKLVFVGPMIDAQEFMDALPPELPTIGFPYPDAPKCKLDWSRLVEQHAPLAKPTPPGPDDLMTLVYTSGTTGYPKGVMLSWRNAQFTVEGLLKAMPPRREEIFFSYLPLAHMFERGAVEISSLYLGAKIYFLEHLEKLPEQLAFVRPTRFFGVPLVYTRIQAGILRKMPQEKLDRLVGIPLIGSLVKRKLKKAIGLDRARYIFSGAAPMPKPLLEWFDKLGIQVLQGYGMTENSIYASANTPSANRIGSVGREMPGASTKISESGEILYKHPGVMLGYYKEPEKTKETFTEDGYLRTGDKGQLDADGYLYITGRVKDIFKTMKGKYVAPAPIEGALARNTDIDQLCFVGSELKQPIMLVSLNDAGKKKPRGDIEAGLIADMEAVNANLEPHEAIGKIVVVKDPWSIDNGLMTPTMKVKRPQVEQRYCDLIRKEGETRSKVAWEG
ncbi:MAG: AMP-binding protein [Stagnimonas sp.]|nr:AMP-binding protein [Stagnimonas sp.]